MIRFAVVGGSVVVVVVVVVVDVVVVEVAVVGVPTVVVVVLLVVRAEELEGRFRVVAELEPAAAGACLGGCVPVVSTPVATKRKATANRRTNPAISVVAIQEKTWMGSASRRKRRHGLRAGRRAEGSPGWDGRGGPGWVHGGYHLPSEALHHPGPTR